VNCTNVNCENDCCFCPVSVDLNGGPTTHPLSYAPTVLPVAANSPVVDIFLSALPSYSLGGPTTHPPSYAPTVLPVAANSPVVDEFLSALPSYSLELATTNTNSSRAKALTWLRHDPLYNEYENVHRLNQRYALAVLYFSTNGRSWLNSTGWLSHDNECEWYFSFMANLAENVCGEGFRLLSLDLSHNELVGTIPTEMELLSDLREMSFDDYYLSTEIFPELYVRFFSANNCRA
jgi:hypothetical protein